MMPLLPCPRSRYSCSTPARIPERPPGELEAGPDSRGSLVRPAVDRRQVVMGYADGSALRQPGRLSRWKGRSSSRQLRTVLTEVIPHHLQQVTGSGQNVMGEVVQDTPARTTPSLLDNHETIDA
jgi:hypothetical protein